MFQSGIVNYKQVCLKLVKELRKEDNKLFLGHQVIKIETKSNNLVIETNHQTIECKHLINCGGLHSDKISKLGGQIHLPK